MNLSSLKNVAVNAANPKYLAEMLRKARARITERYDQDELSAYGNFCALNQVDADQWARKIDADLWDEAKAFQAEHAVHSAKILSEIPVQMGGGGFYSLLYFLTRLTKPACIVETGVAAGFSSRAFLKALGANQSGKLVSSDFPYFRLEDPEKYIGILVEPELKSNWELNIGSDRDNLPVIAKRHPKIDMLHYDSDKTIRGRQFGLEQLSPCFHEDTLIIFDDIQDNLHFRDHVATIPNKSLIFEFGGKYIGVIVPNNKSAWIEYAH